LRVAEQDKERLMRNAFRHGRKLSAHLRDILLKD